MNKYIYRVILHTFVTQVEMLYQRYFLHTNQSHMTHLLALLLILCSVLGFGLLIFSLTFTYQSLKISTITLLTRILIPLLLCVITYAGMIRE